MKSVVLCVWGRVAQDWLLSSTEEQDQVNCVVCMGKGCTRLVTVITVFHRGTGSGKLCAWWKVAFGFSHKIATQSSCCAKEQDQVSCVLCLGEGCIWPLFQDQ